MEYYRSTGEAEIVQQSTTGLFGRLCWYSRVLKENCEGCAGTIEYYKNTWLAVSVQYITK